MNNFSIIRRTLFDDGSWHKTGKNTFHTTAKTNSGILKAVKRYAPKINFSTDIITAYGVNDGVEYRVIICPKARQEICFSQQMDCQRQVKSPTDEKYIDTLSFCVKAVEDDGFLLDRIKEMHR